MLRRSYGLKQLHKFVTQSILNDQIICIKTFNFISDFI